MSCRIIYLNSDTRFVIDGVRNSATGLLIDDADVLLTLLDADGAEIAGEAWPVTMTAVAGEPGSYEYLLPDTLVAQDGDDGEAFIEITDGTLETELTVEVTFETRDAASLDWTSQREMEMMFGASNVSKWADLDNDEDVTKIAQRIVWAAREATEDARSRLRGSPASLITCAPRALRLAVTKLAGVLLYEARGIVDSSDEEGRHRLSSHRKQADLFFRRVIAGQIDVSPGDVTSYPRVVPE